VAKRPAPRSMTIDGKTIYLVAADEYESLTQTRRQVGSYSARLNVLRQQIRIDTELLDHIRTLLADHPPCPPTSDHPVPGCPLCGIRDAIARRDPPIPPTP
jgi:hypothetical protein